MAPACRLASRSGYFADCWQSPSVNLLAAGAPWRAATFTGLQLRRQSNADSESRSSKQHAACAVGRLLPASLTEERVIALFACPLTSVRYNALEFWLRGLLASRGDWPSRVFVLIL